MAEALRGYRAVEQQVKGQVYLGWRRLVMMCEAGAVMSEWQLFPPHLLQVTYRKPQHP
jgi:hypothetical protein